MTLFKDFYTSQKDRLFGYILKRTGNPSLAADLAQESFVKYIGTYGQSSPTSALLYTIGRNLITDHFRRQRPEEPLEEHHQLAGMTQEEKVILREETRLVLQAMEQLDVADAKLLRLVAGSNLSYKEISRITHLSEANVKVRIHRARMQLKNILGTRP
jgi:RNA polymerase sigma-70 factor (ECF subfamily)